MQQGIVGNMFMLAGGEGRRDNPPIVRLERTQK